MLCSWISRAKCNRLAKPAFFNSLTTASSGVAQSCPHAIGRLTYVTDKRTDLRLLRKR